MKKNQRGLMGYVVLIAVFLVIAILLNGGLGQQENKRIEYPQLLTSIREDNVKAVAIRGTSLVGLYRNGKVADADFPDRGYDFETTIGADFIETVRQMTAAKTGKALEDVSVSDLPFTVEYRAPVVTPWYLEYLPYFLSLILIVGLWYFIMMRQGGGNSKVMNFGRSRARVSDPAKNKVTFKDVAGAKEEKEELQEMVDFLKNPKAYTDMGLTLKDQPIRYARDLWRIPTTTLENETFTVDVRMEDKEILIDVRAKQTKRMERTRIRLVLDYDITPERDVSFYVSLFPTPYSDNAACVVPNNLNSIKDLAAIAQCTVLTFRSKKDVYSRYCLVCGNTDIEEKDGNFICNDCGARYAFLSDDQLWLHKFSILQ